MTVTVHQRRSTGQWTWDYGSATVADAQVTHLIAVPGAVFVQVPIEQIGQYGPHFLQLPGGRTFTAGELVALAEARSDRNVYISSTIV